jgi:hypothetical protein
MRYLKLFTSFSDTSGMPDPKHYRKRKIDSIPCIPFQQYSALSFRGFVLRGLATSWGHPTNKNVSLGPLNWQGHHNCSTAGKCLGAIPHGRSSSWRERQTEIEAAPITTFLQIKEKTKKIRKCCFLGEGRGGAVNYSRIFVFRRSWNPTPQ